MRLQLFAQGKQGTMTFVKLKRDLKAAILNSAELKGNTVWSCNTDEELARWRTLAVLSVRQIQCVAKVFISLEFFYLLFIMLQLQASVFSTLILALLSNAN